MKNEITIKLENGETIKSSRKIKLIQLVRSLTNSDDIIAATVNSRLVSLNYIVEKDATISFISAKSREGSKIYIAGLKFIMIAAIKNIYGIKSNVITEHSVDKGIYCSLDIDKEVTEEDINKIKHEMEEIVRKKLPIIKINASTESVEKYFSNMNEIEKKQMYEDYLHDTVTIYKLDKYYGYFFERMPINTSIISKFDLKYIKDNKFALLYPRKGFEIPKFHCSKSMLDTITDYEEFCEKIKVKYVSDINKIVSQNKTEEFIKLVEIEQSNRLHELASYITKNKDKYKVILIGGPSSSGKTTTANKLALYLKTFGVNPFLISVDDFYKEKEETPVDVDGKKNYDVLDAIDIKLFNNVIKELLEGKSVKLPKFNFEENRKEYPGKPKKINSNDILIVEGLHTINEELSSEIPKNQKLKIYVSPFTPLGMDRHNHFSTLDVRLLRRMLRDNQFRGNAPTKTMHLWSKVRMGEEKYIFPFVKDADIIFNTSLSYEIGVLRTYLEPLLHSIKKENDYYLESRRLINLLRRFYPIPGEYVPNESILREFIGGSYFK